MNAVEIEEAVSKLANEPFDAAGFPFAFLEAFGNKETTIKRLKSGDTNQSDIKGGVLQRSNIHIKVCREGEVSNALTELRESPATSRQKSKFILATDGKWIEAENLIDGETISCDFADLSDHFGFFLALAGISTVKEIRENAFDIKATGRLNRLYVELLKVNPDWDTSSKREALNHFFARLIFCFFAEDTNIFPSSARFTRTVEMMSASDASNTHEVLAELFRSMNTKTSDRERQKIKNWAKDFPYVNGGLFSDSLDIPKFSKIARSYLLHVGNLDWTKINPDIFGSMIQAVADDGERGELGMHYTSVPNILKVLNPLFLDDLRAQLKEAGLNSRKLANLRKQLSRIRVFDPACGSGNFLVIAYKEMRAIEAEINSRIRDANNETDRSRSSEIPLTNFRGIELRHFSAEVARLALIIAEYQCDVVYRGQERALAEFLPLEASNWITCGNALRLDWLSICPPTGTGVKLRADDLFSTPLNQVEIEFKNEGSETYICGNPPYLGSTWQSEDQKNDLKQIFAGRTKWWKSLDYVSGWFMKAADYGTRTESAAAFVATNSICQGQQVPILWPLILQTTNEISFAHTSFKWANLASNNAGVTVVIVGIRKQYNGRKLLTFISNDGVPLVKSVGNINPYLVEAPNVFVCKRTSPPLDRAPMIAGGKPVDGGHLLMTPDEARKISALSFKAASIVKLCYGSEEYIDGRLRYCLWVDDQTIDFAKTLPGVAGRFERVAAMRALSTKMATQRSAKTSYRFDEIKQTGKEMVMIVPTVSSENREFLPVGLAAPGTIITNLAFGLLNAPLWNMAIIASRLHLVWIATVCGKLKTDFRYSNTLGWNTFPVPTLTEQNKADLTHCAEGILIARESHFPATIADLYDPDNMPTDLREAHARNDETLERIYIGRRFKNDTERLEKLFEMYSKRVSQENGDQPNKKPRVKRKAA